ncbi:MAG: hypothetical protein M1840_000574 [Geoglossum simile]|nr:MAG: hypothetical protein M1840_000574 [Geoglossum simile]
MSSIETQRRSVRYDPYQHGIASAAQVRQSQTQPQIPDDGIPRKWQVDHETFQINILGKIFHEEMVKYNNTLQSYYNSLINEEAQSHYLEGLVRNLQSKVQDAESRRIATEKRMETLQMDYQRLATCCNQNSITPGYSPALFSPTEPPQDTQLERKRKADPVATCSMPKRMHGMAATAPPKVEDMY